MNLSEIRKRAREALRGKWGIAIIASLIASALGAEGNGGVNFNFELDDSDIENLENMGLENLFTNFEAFIEQHFVGILGFLGIFMILGIAISIVMFCLGSIVSLGYRKFNLDLVDGTNAEIGSLFSYFKHWKTAIVANLLQTLYIFLWSLLCVIPGIIAGYNYAMVPYILADNPNLAPREALQKSKEMMYGHRWQYFLLNLSFIGWSILCIFTCGIGFIWLIPYINAATAEFYREISGSRGSYQYNYV